MFNGEINGITDSNSGIAGRKKLWSFGYANYFIEKRIQGVGTEFLCENRVLRLSSHSMFNYLPA